MRVRAGSSLLASVAALATGPVAAQISPDQSAAIDRLFEARIGANSPGCVVGLARGGSLIHWRGYGLADVESATPFTQRTVFGTGSVYKHFVSADLLLLERQGRVSLTDSIRRYLPELPGYAEGITIRHLLDHTHGLRETGDLQTLTNPGARTDAAATLQLIARQHAPAAAPGARFRYGNTGPYLAQIIIERVSGETVGRHVAAHLFEPMGMSGTALGEDGRPVAPRIAGYVGQPDGTRLRRPPSMGYRTAIEDLARWNGLFDSADSRWAPLIRTLTTPGRLADGSQTDYGLGLRLSTYRGLERIWAPGAGNGFRAMFMRFPGAGLAITLGCNFEVNPIEIAEGVADIVLADEIARQGRSDDGRNRPGGLPSAQARRIMPGTYVSESGHVVRIAGEGRRLRITWPGAEHELIPLGAFRFALPPRAYFGRNMAVDRATEVIYSPRRGRAPARLVLGTDWYPFEFTAVDASPAGASNPSAYVGRYRSDEVESELTVFLRDGRLLARMPQGEHALEPVARDLFAAGPQTIRFEREDGTVTRAVVSRGAAIPFARIGG